MKESIGLKVQYKLAIATAFLVVVVMVALSYGTLHDPVDTLTLAAASGDLSEVQITLDRGAPVDGRDRAGKTALISASKNGRKEVIELLLAKGADINSRGSTARAC
jgi:hypothetical protein